MERPLYVVISSIPDTIYYQEVERKPYITEFLKKFAQMEKSQFRKRILPRFFEKIPYIVHPHQQFSGDL